MILSFMLFFIILMTLGGRNCERKPLSLLLYRYYRYLFVSKPQFVYKRIVIRAKCSAALHNCIVPHCTIV